MMKWNRTAAGIAGSALLACTSLAADPAPAQPVEETKEQRDQRMAWWREAKFGMFIHWGVYAVPAGTYKDKQVGGIGEWIMRNGKIPVTDYREYARQFNPTKYDPKAWAAVAKRAGMRYMVITSKHHDGFTMFPSAASKWNIADASPYGKDLIGPLADAARAEGLKFGLYYSQAQDWNNPGGAKSGSKDGEGWDDAHKGQFDDYLKNVCIPQVREILTKYHPAVIWWDTPHLMTPERAKPLNDLLALEPGIIVNNRLGGGYKGDTETPEQHIPAMGYKDRDWETCMTMNDTWGFKSYDHNWKPVKKLLQNLVDIVSKGGNYLLNVGPTAEGEIPPESIERLAAVGRWMDVNGEAIYGTTATPFEKLVWGRCTKKVGPNGGTLFIHVFDWPADGKLVLPGLRNKVTGAKLLAGGAKVEATASEDGVVLSGLPGAAPDEVASVIAVTIEGALDVRKSLPTADAKGMITLTPQLADLNNHLGSDVRVEGDPANIGYWTSPKATVSWNFKAPQAGDFVVEINGSSTGGSKLSVEVTGGAKLTDAAVEKSGDYAKYERRRIGTLKIPAGENTIKLVPSATGWQPINIREVRLIPVG